MLAKQDMARVIVQALYGLRELPPGNDFRVQRMMQRRKVVLANQYRMAKKVLEDVAAGRLELRALENRGL